MKIDFSNPHQKLLFFFSLTRWDENWKDAILTACACSLPNFIFTLFNRQFVILMIINLLIYLGLCLIIFKGGFNGEIKDKSEN
jgi:uncharacterized membrane protein